MLLTLTPDVTGATTLTVINDGADTGYELLQGASFGSPVWDHTFSGSRGTQGARPAQGRLPNREVVLPIRVAGTSKDNLATKISTLAAAVDDLRRYGGICRMRSRSQTYAQRFEVLTATSDIPEWNNRLEQRDRAVMVVNLTCGPYVLGDPMDFADDFSTDNVNGGDASYTADEGALTNMAVTGGVLDGAANLGVYNSVAYTGGSYTYGDCEATVLAVPGSTITSFTAGVVLKRIDASNLLLVDVEDDGAQSDIIIYKRVAGTYTNLASTTLGSRIADGVRFWVRGRIEGNVVYGEHFASVNVPHPTATPTTTVSYTLTTAEAATFGAGVEGRAGFGFTPQHTDAYLDDFEILPFTYSDPGMAVLDCFGTIPGDAPALADVRIGASTASPWGLVAWTERTDVENYVLRGGGELPTTAYPWTIAGISGVTGAATSVTRVTDDTMGAGAKYGAYATRIVTPATANTGAAYPIYRRFREGLTYTAKVWVQAPSATTTVRIRLGVSGDIQSSSAVALTTTWTEHSITWTPSSTVELAYLAIEVTAATGTTFYFDGAAVYRGTTEPALTQQLQGEGAVGPLAVFGAEASTEGDVTVTISADATATNGYAVIDSSVNAGGDEYIARIPCDIDLGNGDDYAYGEVAVEVYARVMVSAAFTGGVTAKIDAYATHNLLGPVTHTIEGGSTGLALTLPSSSNDLWRMTRVGSLNLSPGRWYLNVIFTVAAGTNAQDFRFDTIYLVPARSRFASPTGKAFSGVEETYPEFVVVNAQSRTVKPDLSSTWTFEGGIVTPAGGVLGSLVEIPPGDISLLAILQTQVPDDTVAHNNDQLQEFPATHLAITPRWHWLRTT